MITIVHMAHDRDTIMKLIIVYGNLLAITNNYYDYYIYLRLWSSISDRCDGIRADRVHHVLELARLNAGHLFGFGNLQLVLFSDKLCLCLASTSQPLQLRFLTNKMGMKTW